jgi:hypothetical protein
VDPKTGIQYFKEVDAVTGQIMRRYFFDTKAPVKLEELQIQPGNQ